MLALTLAEQHGRFPLHVRSLQPMGDVAASDYEIEHAAEIGVLQVKFMRQAAMRLKTDRQPGTNLAAR